MTSCRCDELPAKFELDPSKPFLGGRAHALEDRNGARLFRCEQCAQHWHTELDDSTQPRVARRVTSQDEWTHYLDDRWARRQLWAQIPAQPLAELDLRHERPPQHEWVPLLPVVDTIRDAFTTLIGQRGELVRIVWPLIAFDLLFFGISGVLPASFEDAAETPSLATIAASAISAGLSLAVQVAVIRLVVLGRVPSGITALRLGWREILVALAGIALAVAATIPAVVLSVLFAAVATSFLDSEVVLIGSSGIALFAGFLAWLALCMVVPAIAVDRPITPAQSVASARTQLPRLFLLLGCFPWGFEAGSDAVSLLLTSLSAGSPLPAALERPLGVIGIVVADGVEVLTYALIARCYIHLWPSEAATAAAGADG